MKKILKTTAVGLVAASVLAAGCSKGSEKCGKVVDKSFEMVMQLMSGFSKMAADKAAAQKKMDEAKKSFETKKPEMVKACQAELKSNKDADKALDCFLAAKDMMEAQKCDPTGKVNFMKPSAK